MRMGLIPPVGGPRASVHSTRGMPGPLWRRSSAPQRFPTRRNTAPASSRRPGGKPMNVILIISDTMRRDDLASWLRARADTEPRPSSPSSRACSNALRQFPHRPVRMDVMTAAPSSRPVAALLRRDRLPVRRGGYTTMMIADTRNIRQRLRYDRGFSGWSDPARRTTAGAPRPRTRELPPRRASPQPPTVRQHLRNTWHRRGEEDTFCAMTMRGGRVAGREPRPRLLPLRGHLRPT